MGLRIKNKYIQLLIGVLFLSGIVQNLYAQPENPPRPMVITSTSSLSFGVFSSEITGGTIQVDEYGVRTSSGDIVLYNLGYLYYPASFQVDVNPGHIITITLGTLGTLGHDILLSDGVGHTMKLEPNGIYPLSPFVTTTDITDIYVGGILTVGNMMTNPPGTYNGTITVIFNYQ